MTDGTNDSVTSDIEVGLITQLSERQSEVLALINDARDSTDKSMEEGMLSTLGYDDDIIVAMVLAHKEIHGPNTDIVPMDLMWASAFLDHLDTLGFCITNK